MKLFKLIFALFIPVVLFAQDSSWVTKETSAALQTIKGDKPAGYYLAGFVFSLAGIFISLYWSSTRRNKQSNNTPDKFSIWFLVFDNAKRIVISLIVGFLLFRMFDLFEIWEMVGVGIGVTVGLDQIIEIMMNRWDWVCQLLKQDRSKLVITKTDTDAQNNQP